MNAITIKDFGMKIKTACNNGNLRLFLVFILGTILLFGLGTDTLCAASTDSIINQMINVIADVARYVGILITVGGIFMLVLAYKDDNADQQARAIRLIVVGGVLIGLKTIISAFGLV